MPVKRQTVMHLASVPSRHHRPGFGAGQRGPARCPSSRRQRRPRRPGRPALPDASRTASQWLGSNLIGAKVVSATNETIGRIANLLVNDDGVEAAVISVGGVFGVGKKNVAVTYKSLNIVRTKAGDAIDHVTLAATRRMSEAAGQRSRGSEMRPRRQIAAVARRRHPASGDGYTASLIFAAVSRSTETSCETPRSAMVTPNRRFMRAMVIGLCVMMTKRVSVSRVISSSRSQKRSTL